MHPLFLTSGTQIWTLFWAPKKGPAGRPGALRGPVSGPQILPLGTGPKPGPKSDLCTLQNEQFCLLVLNESCIMSYYLCIVYNKYNACNINTYKTMFIYINKHNICFNVLIVYD